MLQFKNLTRFAGTVAVLPDVEGVDSVYAIIKGTFTIGSEATPAEVQLPVTHQDQYHGEPGRSSLKAASDVCLAKRATDVLLSGHAYADHRQTSESRVDVRLTIGPVHKTVRVFGDRIWDSGLLGARISSPLPFDKIPLVWERAYGGFDQTEANPPKMDAESRNPVGTGFRMRNGINKLKGTKLPNLENPESLIRSSKDRPMPVNFGYIGPSWEPRKSWAGTYDEEWQKHRAPYLPKDFDARYFQVAPEDQVVLGYLKGGEHFEVSGASPNGPLRCQLPRYRVEITYHLDEQKQLRTANLDTMIIEPDAGSLVLIWRAVMQCDKRVLRVREIRAKAIPF